MGIKLIILLALLVGVLYSLHLLVKDYQALTAPRLLRFLFKRDVSSQYNLKPGVRWKAILRYDPVKCARYLYCDLGARPANNAVRRGFAYMLTLEPQKENRAAWEVFKQAYEFGQALPPSRVEDCHLEYSMCPFHSRLLFELIDYMIRYIATEHPKVTFFDNKYMTYVNLTSKRYGRQDPFYYVGFNAFFAYEFHNNITVDFYFFEYLTNRYKRGFVEMHFGFCDLIHKDTFFGSALKQGKFLKPCPFAAGAYNLSNMTIPLKRIPHNFPFSKGRIYCNISSTATKVLIASGYINMEIREAHTNKKNWVDVKT